MIKQHDFALLINSGCHVVVNDKYTCWLRGNRRDLTFTDTDACCPRSTTSIDVFAKIGDNTKLGAIVFSFDRDLGDGGLISSAICIFDNDLNTQSIETVTNASKL